MYADGFTKRLREAQRTTSSQEQSSRLCLLILCAQYAAPGKTSSLSNNYYPPACSTCLRPVRTHADKHKPHSFSFECGMFVAAERNASDRRSRWWLQSYSYFS